MAAKTQSCWLQILHFKDNRITISRNEILKKNLKLDFNCLENLTWCGFLKGTGVLIASLF